MREKLNVMVRELSLGERMKMELIAALLHQPKVLFLDEPTIGLDVISQKIVREFLAATTTPRAGKRPMLLTSHYMTDIQALCRRVVIIDHGKIFFDGALSEVIDRFADFKLITIQCGLRASNANPRIAVPLWRTRWSRRLTVVKLKVKRDRVIAVCKALLDELPVTDIDIQEVPIEDIIRQIFAR